MKVTIVIPDERQLATAGVRIRYHRLATRLDAAGHELDLQPIDALAGSNAPADVVVFSKCHDARTVALADELRGRGARVGVDVFDDYYSDASDSRFVHLREWLRTLSTRLDFAMCSTPLMSDKLTAILPELPIHVMHDASIDLDEEALAERVERNAERALSTRRVDVTWFGIGDNPHFRLGLSDLFAYSNMLLDFVRAGYRPQVSILTNRRALDAERLEFIARLPVSAVLEEWSEELEAQSIAASLFCFLPVRAQNFSVVKSLNRAITTLTGGAQALSGGYPLYSELRPFVYDAAAPLIADLEAGTLALRRETVGALGERLASWGNAEVEARRLAAFLEGLAPTPSTAPAVLTATVHGRQSPAPVHALAQRLGHLSVASPFNQQKLPFDLRFANEEGAEPAIILSAFAATKLTEEARARLRIDPARIGSASIRLRLDELATPCPFDPGDLTACRSLAVVSMRYDAAMAYVADVLAELFGPVRITVSELVSPLWSDVGRRAAACPAGGEQAFA